MNSLKLETYYHEEVYEKLRDLHNTLEVSSESDVFTNKLYTILLTAEQIRDLGMIHGYDEVESIADAFLSAVKYCATRGQEHFHNCQDILVEALQSLQQIIEQPEAGNIDERVERIRNKLAKVVPDSFVPDTAFAQENTEWLPEPAMAKNGADADQTAFDQFYLRSSELADIDKIGDELLKVSAEGEPAIADLQPLQGSSNGGDQFDDIAIPEAALAGAVLEKIHVCLDDLEEQLSIIVSDLEIELASQLSRELCAELDTLTAGIDVAPLREVIRAMHRAADEYLSEEDWKYAAVIFHECVLLIREAMNYRRISNTAALNYKERLNSLMQTPADRFPIQTWTEATQSLQEDPESEAESSTKPGLPFIVRMKRLFGMY